MTRIFYFVVSGLTLWAAAVQWLPREGLPTQLDFGPEEARAQSPAANSLFPQPPIAAEQQEARAMPPGATSGGQANASFGTAVPTAPSAPSGYPTQPPLSTLGPVSWQPATQELQEAKVLARVGGEVIMAGEVLSSVKGYLIRNKLDPKNPEVASQMGELVKMRTMQLVETRIVCNEAKRKIPAEGFKGAMQKFDEEFDKSVVPQMLKERKVDTVQQLEAELRKEGTSLEREKRSFAEQVLRNSWLQQSVKVNQDVTHEELLAYYHDHAKDYELIAQARWEQLTMRFDKFPGKAEAYAAIAAAGNQVLDGRAFGDVAKEVSHGSTASSGGVHDWTSKGSLVSKTLDDALFTLAVGTLSPILEDERGFHIIRVTERKDAGRKSFVDVQNDIRKTVQNKRMEDAKLEYLKEIKAQAQVWTIFDEPIQTAQPKSGTLR